MPKSKAQKQETINDFKETLSQAQSIVFADIQGLKAKDLVLLRRKIKEAAGQLKIAKKTLIDIALKDALKGESVKKMVGEVAVLFALKDPVLPLKSLYGFSKEHENLKFIAGIFDNALLGKEEVLAIAQLPPREELLTRLVGNIASPMSGLLHVLQGNIKGLITVLAKAKT